MHKNLRSLFLNISMARTVTNSLSPNHNLNISGIVGIKALFRLGTRARARSSATKMDVVHTRQCPELKMFINN